MLDEPLPGFLSWDRELAKQPTTPIADEVAGYDMLYSSGTTGRPKGIKRQSENNPIDAAESVPENALRRHVRHELRQHLSVAGAAVSRRSACAST